MEAYQSVNTFNTVEISTKVRLKPWQMTYDWKSFLKKNLEKRVVGKCTNDGMITEIKQITDYNSNIIVREDFSGDTEFNITYIAIVCVPLVNTVAVLKVKSIIFDSVDFLTHCSNGFITCVLRASKNTGTITVEQGKLFVNGNETPLKPDMYIKVYITEKRVIAGDETIGVMGKMVDIATKDEVRMYYKSTPEVDEEEAKETDVVYNDDDYGDI